MGSPIGAILASSVGAWTTHAYSVNGQLSAEFYRYGWRIPFLASAGLVAIGLVIRISVSESPAFEVMRQKVLAEILAYTSQGLLYGPLAALFSEAFPANVRYMAASIAYHGAALAGGMAPVIGTALLSYSHGRSWVLSLYIIATGCVSLASLAGLKYRVGRPAGETEAPEELLAPV